MINFTHQKCRVCKGHGQLDIEFEYSTGEFDRDFGPSSSVDVKATIVCKDCGGEGEVGKDMLEEQDNRTGDVEDWIDEMIADYIADGPHDEEGR